jgi:hypothetical protein
MLINLVFSWLQSLLVSDPAQSPQRLLYTGYLCLYMRYSVSHAAALQFCIGVRRMWFNLIKGPADDCAMCGAPVLTLRSALDRPVDWSLIRDLGSKAAVVYNPRDPWFQQYGTMHQVLPDVEVSNKHVKYKKYSPQNSATMRLALQALLVPVCLADEFQQRSFNCGWCERQKHVVQPALSW